MKLNNIIKYTKLKNNAFGDLDNHKYSSCNSPLLQGTYLSELVLKSSPIAM